jgi:hypothetical protein
MEGAGGVVSCAALAISAAAAIGEDVTEVRYKNLRVSQVSIGR